MANKPMSVDPVLAELIAIKRLIVFALLKGGASQKQIATALGIDQSQVSRMFPGGIGSASKAAGKSS
jgi:predicted XRE-type DNA-binding protein